MSTKRTKVLSFLMALVFMFGTISPCLTIADDIDPTPTPEPIIETIDNIDEAQLVEGGGEEKTENEIHIISGFDVEFDEETGVQLPLFELTIDANVNPDEINFPKSVKGYIDAEETVSDIPVVAWETLNNNDYDIPDGYYACVPVFDEQKYYVYDDAFLPYGIIFIQQSEELKSVNSELDDVVTDDIAENETQNEVENEVKNSVEKEEDNKDAINSSAVLNGEETNHETASETVCETNKEADVKEPADDTKEPVGDDVNQVDVVLEDEANSEDNEITDENNKPKIVSFYSAPNSDTADEPIPSSINKRFSTLLFYLTIPNGWAINQIVLPDSVYAILDTEETPVEIKIEGWKVSDELIKEFSEKYTILEAVLPIEYEIGENVELPHGAILFASPISISNNVTDKKGGLLKAAANEVHPGDSVPTNTDNCTYYFQVNTGSQWRDLNTKFHYYTKNGTKYVLYCLQHKVGGVAGDYNVVDMDELSGKGRPAIGGLDADVIRGLKVILQNGYPLNKISGVTPDDVSRQATQQVIRVWQFINNAGQEDGGENASTYKNAFSLGTRSNTRAERLALFKAMSKNELAQRFTKWIRAKNTSTRDACANYMADIFYKALHDNVFIPTISAQNVTLTWNSTNGRFEGTTTVTNNTNGDFTYSTPSGFTITRSGNTLTITAGRDKANTSNTSVTLTSHDSRGEGSLLGFYPTATHQTTMGLATQAAEITGSFKINVGGLPEGTLAITKSSGNTSITDGNSNYSLSGAVYTVYTAASGGTNKGTITTGSNGAGTSTLTLAPGTYYVEETTAPAGYVKNTGRTAVTITAGQTTTLTTGVAVDTPIVGSLKITKSSANTGVTNGNSNYTLQGAVYELKSGNTVVKTLTTDASGVATASGIPLGTYTLTEKTAPQWYVVSSGSYTVNITSATQVALTASNTAILSETPITGALTITKSSANASITNGNSNYSLAGAVYELKSGTTVVKTLTTNASGVASATEIPLGTYTLTEKTASPGYQLNTGSKVVTFTAAAPGVTLTASNAPVLSETPITGSLTITKSSGNTSITNGNSNYSLQGAVYKLVGNGKTYTFPATTADGKASLSNLPLGSYVLSEVTPPPGYEANTNTYTVVISEAQLVHNLNAVDTNVLSDTPIVGSVKITKQSAAPAITNGNSCYSLEGAKYSLYRADGTLVSQKTTNADGEIVFTNLPVGNYYILETEPSQGYELNTERLDVSITSSAQESFTGVKCLKENPLNDPIVAIVYKVDADTGERVPQGDASLAGAQFTVKYYDAFYDEVPASATPVYTWIFATDEDGFVDFAEAYKVSGPALPVNVDGDPCVPLGTITIQETLPPEGYLINPSILTYKIESEGGVMLAQYPNGLEIPETVKKGRFTIEKYLMDTVNGSVSAETAQASATPEVGAIFQVIDSEGIVVDTLTTGQNGKATTIELPYGTYTLHQISGTTGYVFVEDSMITISENGENRTYKYYNDRKYAALHVIKKDAETGNVIAVAGVTFEIYDSNNQKVVLDGQSSFTTDANGEFTTPKRLPYGSYTLKETIAPEGYALPTSSISFVINDATYGTDGIVTKEAFDSKASCEINLYKTGLICTGFETVTENGYQVTRPKFEEGFLTGVVFSLYAKTDILNNNGTVKYHAGELVMDNVTTEADGHAHFRWLQSGTYEVRETSTLNGYLLLSEPIEVTCDLGDAQEIVVEPVGPIYNELKSVEIKFLKQKQIFSVSNGSGSYSYVTASGFTFGLYSGETLTLIGSGTAYTLPANTLIATAVSDSNGQVNFAGYYPAGNYYVKELEVQNDAYMLDDATYPISITMTNTAPQTVVIDNTSTPIHNDLYKANIKVVKKDAETGNVIPLAGATFEIRNSNDILVDTVVTDATGHAETSIALPYGTYSIKETVPPEGYVLDSTPNNILIDSTTVETDEAVEYVEYVANDTRIKGKITVVKKGLALTAANVEAENGFQVTKLAYTEEFLPNVKIDLYAVEDIVFLGEVKYAAGTKVTSGTTTSEGRLEFDELYLGSYELRETESASDVYVLPSQNEQVTLTSTNNTIDVVERTVNMNNVVRDVEISFVKKVPSVSTTTNGENVTTTISTNHSDFIAATEGFVFGLYNSTAIEMYNNNGTIPANTLLATATIGQNGVVSFNQKLPHGTYYIKEIASPEKYAALTGNIDGFTIIPDDLTQDSIEISLGDVYNELITVDMSIYKYDEDTEAPLGTALFEIKDNDTDVVLFRGRTNDSGMLGPVAIYPGSFTLTELEAPEDYDIAEPITFTVTPEGKVMVGETEIQNGQFNIPDEYINIPNVVLPRTGSKAALWLTIGGGIAVAAGIAVFIIVGKKKKDDDE